MWKVYRGKKKDRGNMDVSIFIFEKKSLEKKKLTQNQKDEICNILKKDPQTLAKFRHPNMLSLIEQPLEDAKIIAFVTEPVEYNLSSLVFDATKKELIPGDLEIKCLMLELLEGLNFLHSSAKTIHMALAPEHIYITKEGKLKIGGLNFPQQFTTAEQLGVPLNFDLRLGDFAMVPNLQFSAPELTDKSVVSVQSDIYSVGTLLYFMVALNKGKSPFLINMKDMTDKGAHKFEINQMERKLASMFQGIEHEIEMIVRQAINNEPTMRGTLNQLVEKQWFQDPLLKTIKYLENFDQKEHANKVQFLNGIQKILEKFDKKALVKKVIPLLLDALKIPQLSVNILPSVLSIMERPNYLTTTEFREHIWPAIIKLCKAKELPAQSLFILLKNTEIFLKFVGPAEFQANFMPLLLKSLECGVAKLQFLALDKVKVMYKQLDYTAVKTSLIPRILSILEKSPTMQLKVKVLETILEMIGAIDQHTMKDVILKSFDKVRAQETDPHLYMLLMKIYEQMAKVLGPEEIGLKILPGMIPMLISGTFSKAQFKELISSVRRFLDQIEEHRDKDLRDMGSEIMKGSDDAKAFDFDQFEPKKEQPVVSATNDAFDFLTTLDTKSQTSSGRSSLFGTSSTQNPNDIFSAFEPAPAQAAPKFPPPPTATNTLSSDPFGGMSNTFGAQKVTPPKQTTFNTGGWDSDMPNILDFGGGSQPKQTTFPSAPINNPQPQMNMGFGVQNMPRTGGLKAMSDDPFAELIEGGSNSNPSFGGSTNPQFSSGFGGGMSGFGQQPQQPTFNAGFGAPPQQQMNNAFGGLNLGGGQQNAFGANAFGGQQSNNDDFFSQFSNSQQQKNNQGAFNF